MSKRGAFLTVVLLALTGCGGGEPPVAEQAPTRYVAIGDSYTAAPGAGLPVGSPAVCGRSEHNYPRLVAKALRPADFVDASCGGATTEHLTRAQRTAEGVNPPQLGAVTANTELVTIGLGANDVGIFQWAQDCRAQRRTESPCLDRLTAGGRDRVADAVAATAGSVGETVRRVKKKAPRATVLLVGYPTVLPAKGTTCWPEPRIGDSDVVYLRHGLNDLNAMLAVQARRHDVTFVDTAAGSAGHGMCAPPEQRWVEGFRSVTGAASLHPTARGQQATADAVLAAIAGDTDLAAS